MAHTDLRPARGRTTRGWRGRLFAAAALACLLLLELTASASAAVTGTIAISPTRGPATAVIRVTYAVSVAPPTGGQTTTTASFDNAAFAILDLTGRTSATATLQIPEGHRQAGPHQVCAGSSSNAALPFVCTTFTLIVTPPGTPGATASPVSSSTTSPAIASPTGVIVTHPASSPPAASQPAASTPAATSAAPTVTSATPTASPTASPAAPPTSAPGEGSGGGVPTVIAFGAAAVLVVLAAAGLIGLSRRGR